MSTINNKYMFEQDHLVLVWFHKDVMNQQKMWKVKTKFGQ